ncbi:uncharacterized protein LOC131937883 isoform X1 [Physella acuta]|uniref:uncharacterized protein LOC131937883 isoform X1 n=1 Tax=Physella acuta TaxID=109671 RepID=UPI0027DABD02|nr:uncharacterized protein LOC131937883 isoform X1 [Physella acuta]
MALITVALAFLGVWSISAQVLHKSIVPKVLKRGSEATVVCDSDLAGVPENGSPEGIYFLKLSWNKKFFYSFSRFGTGITPGVKTHWRTRVSGHYPKNSRGLFDRDKFRLELDMINISFDDKGEFCCFSSISKNGRRQLPLNRCEDFIVTDHSIVEASTVAQDPNDTIIQCTPDLAGVPDTATEIDRAELFWQNEDFDPNLCFLYTLRIFWYNQRYPYVNIINHAGKDHWRMLPFYQVLKPNKRLVKDETTLAIAINGLEYQDAGWFCCSVNYFDKDDVNRLAYRCHYLSASRIQAVKLSRNGSSIKRVTENLIFGLLIFSWIQLHICRGE